ncbi:MAG TPA: Do family serine endopeptidase [Terriglobales bacterium]|jgi:serine protease Do|nr:Do family serine endopeptidase [Terriglobales bacterium]
MKSWLTRGWKACRKQPAVIALTLALAASFVVYSSIYNPFTAARAGVSSNTAPLDNSQIGPLLSLDQAMEAVAARVTPAIVNVAVTSRMKSQPAMQGIPDDLQRFFGQQFGGQQFGGPGMQSQPRLERGIGSGVIISPDGYIVTNNHVVDSATEIKVTLSDRRIMTAKLIGTDPLTDLAVIKIDGTNLPNIPIGDSSSLHPGQTVLAFGNPFGFRFTVTRGIVSALNRPNPYSDDPHKPGQFIQTDAAINPGNSGGPLVNARGEVVGINTFLISSSGSFSGMGFAIPTQIVNPVVQQLVRNGKVAHGRMGVGITDVTPENAKFFDVNDSNGAVITQVESGSAGAKAGLKVGDVIREVNGKKITDAGQLQMEISSMTPGTAISLQVVRDGKSVNVPITLQGMEADDKETKVADNPNDKPRWGVGIADLTPEVREQLRIPDDLQGAVIQRVQPGSPSDDAGLQPGQVIVGVNRHETRNASDVQKALTSVPKGQDALVLIWANGGNTFRVLHSTNGA